MANPLCPYFGKCGGCSLQHIDYQVQLENKKRLLAKATNYGEVTVFSGPEYFYRNRMDIIFCSQAIGLREKGNWKKIVDVDRCVIADEKLNFLLKEVRAFFTSIDYFDVLKRSGTFRYAVIRTPQNDSSISFVLNSESSKIKEAIEKIVAFAKKTTANNIIVTYVPPNTEVTVSKDFFVVKGGDTLQESFLGKKFFYSVQGFFQNNTFVAGKMHEHCHSLLKKHNTNGANLLDLYGGVGTFGIINAELFRKVVIIENEEECVKSLKKNIQHNNTRNVEAILLDAMQLKKVELPQPLFVITDPPRSGMHQKTIEQLKKLKPEVIIYISCNIQQLGKDLQKFKNYEIKSVALFDLFPQTNHTEAIAELVLKK
ncbi:23S rRNA (uracil(1939)-C(5))-methyltransferase RlmD [Candidatus Woesearchaeota archaeon]|nr:23S rRNA (uracil(1939)-C(5))-methyltransferase RlmD [Candidatus Woesearchaeota archaeon]